MKTTIFYTCDYCAGQSQNKLDMIEHEKRCSYNPATKYCCTCSCLYENELMGIYCGGGSKVCDNFKGGCPMHRSRK